MSVNVFNRVIAGGVIDVSSGTGIYNIATVNADPLDPLNWITQIAGATHPHIYEFRVAVDGRFWTITHNPAGNIVLQNEQGFRTQDVRDFILLRAVEVGIAVFDLWRGRF